MLINQLQVEVLSEPKISIHGLKVMEKGCKLKIVNINKLHFLIFIQNIIL